jgi:hypothetical protein
VTDDIPWELLDEDAFEEMRAIPVDRDWATAYALLRCARAIDRCAKQLKRLADRER